MAKCSVCEFIPDENMGFCPRCSWEFKLWTKGISPEEDTKYQERLKIARRNWQTLQALKKGSDTIETSENKKPDPASGSKSAGASYSEKTPLPDLRRDPFETVEEFQAKISGHHPVLAGKATLLKEKYDIKTGKFPMDVSWEEWTRNVEGMPSWDSDIHLIAERDLARAIYEAGPDYALFAKFKAEKEKASVNAIELFTGSRALPVIIPVRIGSNPETWGDVWADPVTGMEFMKVPGGTFMMGDIFGDGEEDEMPVHEVLLDSFYIGKYPVTQGEWKKVIGSPPAKFQKGDNYPIEIVSWDDIQNFIRKLTEMNRGKYHFRLPTEAEWEYAARSGGKEERYAGGDDIDAVAWYEKNSDSTHPVGRKVPNGLGIHDMTGNVWERCEDWYGEYPPGPVRNPTGPSSGSSRVRRGGSWNSSAESCRLASRCRCSTDSLILYLGIRLAISAVRQ